MANDIQGEDVMMNHTPEVSDTNVSDTSSSRDRQASSSEERSARAVDSQPPSAERPAALRVNVTLRDSTVQCVCPQGTIRRGEEMALLNTKGGVTWIHLPCRPFKRAVIADQVLRMKERLQRAAQAVQESGGSVQEVTEKLLLTSLGPNATDIQKAKTRNLNKFLCDGSCTDSANAASYLRCKRCCTWQHSACMLYDGSRDRGGPVCNQCYMSFITHREEIMAWQKKRLAQAGIEALKFIRDPNNQHETWRLEFAMTFLGKMISKNKVEILKFVISRRRVQRFLESCSTEKEKNKHGSGSGLNTAPAKKSKKRSTRSKRKSLKKESSPEAALDNDEEYEDTIVVKQKSAPIMKASKIKRELPPPLILPPTEEDDAQMALLRAAAAAKAKNKPKATGPATQPATPASRGNPKKRPSRAISDVSSSASPPRHPPKAARKSAPKPSSTESVDEDEGDLINARTLRPRRAGQRNVVVDDDGDGDFEEEEEELARKEEGPPVSCTCAPGQEAPFRDCLRCEECGYYQCPNCASVDDAGMPLCNFCFADAMEEAMQADDPTAPWNKSQVSAVPPQPAAPNPNHTAPKVESTPAPPLAATFTRTPLDAHIAGELLALCTQYLWPAYCEIPDSDSDIDPMFIDHAAVPPSDWLKEATLRLTIMFEAAGSEKTNEYLRPVLAAWPREAGKILRELREMALWMKQRGPFRKCKQELGLLAEILGLEDKGTYWAADTKEETDEK